MILAVFCAYANSLWGDFQFSDYNVIVANPVVHSWDRWFHNATHGGIRPLLKLSYTLNWLADPGPFGFHVVNVAVHGVNVLLVYWICRECTAAWFSLSEDDYQDLPALLAALLFAVHPLQTEAVTYISGRSSSLMALFYLGSLLAYIKGCKLDKWQLRFILSPILFFLAVAVKETALSLPLALLLWERSAGCRSWKRTLAGQSIHWGVFLAILAVILTNRKYLDLLLFSSTIRNAFENLLSQINGMVYLLSRLIMIHGMNIDPDVPASTSLNPQMWWILGAMALCTFFVIWKKLTRPWLAFGMLWFVVVLIPSNSVIPRLDIVNERHFYLAGIGLYLAAGIELVLLCRRLHFDRLVRTAIIGTGISILALFTVLRNNDYRSEISLWESTVRNSPDKSRGYNNLGCAYELGGRPKEAAAAFFKALQLEPDNETALRNMGRLENTAK
jgi:tetratricopeptide (TPR) repeat protein